MKVSFHQIKFYARRILTTRIFIANERDTRTLKKKLIVFKSPRNCSKKKHFGKSNHTIESNRAANIATKKCSKQIRRDAKTGGVKNGGLRQTNVEKSKQANFALISELSKSDELALVDGAKTSGGWLFSPKMKRKAPGIPSAKRIKQRTAFLPDDRKDASPKRRQTRQGRDASNAIGSPKCRD